LARAIEWLERRDINLYMSFCYGHLARAELEAGRVELASGHALRALERAQRGDPLGQAMAYRVLAVLSARRGNEQEAREYCDKSLVSSERRASPRDIALTQLTLGELERGWNNPEVAHSLLEAARARFEELRMTWHVVESERLLRAR
jgi:tetratricopeptide (TPR) repeat protein